MAVLSSSFFGICLLLLPAAIFLQLMTTASGTVDSQGDADRLKGAEDRFNQESDTNSAETQRDLAYLKQLLDERYLDLETESSSKHDEEAELRRKEVHLLRKILSDVDIHGPPKKKRTCKVNLGGNCATEDAVSMADHWHFLSSALSPGRRRRQASSSSSSSSSFSIRRNPPPPSLPLHPFLLNSKIRVSSTSD